MHIASWESVGLLLLLFYISLYSFTVNKPFLSSAFSNRYCNQNDHIRSKLPISLVWIRSSGSKPISPLAMVPPIYLLHFSTLSISPLPLQFSLFYSFPHPLSFTHPVSFSLPPFSTSQLHYPLPRHLPPERERESVWLEEVVVVEWLVVW